MKQIFPKEIVDNTVEVHQFKHSTKSRIIYAVITLSVLLAIIALPFIKVSVYNTSQGFVKPDKERISLQIGGTGEVIYHQLLNNKKVIKGDTLLVLNTSSVKQKIKTTSSLIEETNQFIYDIEVLLSTEKSSKLLKSLKFKQEFLSFQQKRNDLKTRLTKLKHDHNRNTTLYNKGVIAKVTLENTKLEYDLALNAISQLHKQQNNTWQTELVNYKNKLQEFINNKVQLTENNSLSVLKAPVSGTLLNVKGIEKGNYIGAGLQLAEISPDTNLLVECYISPSDIGLLKKQDEVNFQVAAFNYNQWGLATGKIIDIANDVQMMNNTPVFKVQCSLDEDYLQLTSGFKGYLKKGMTLNARFELAERSLFNLLYDKMDDWLNPTNGIAKN